MLTALKHRCRFCGKWRHRVEFLGPVAVAPCLDCWQWHAAAIRVLAGGTPPGCQVCRMSWDDLRRRTTQGGAVRMFLHPKDGILQVLCPACSDRYERKRLDLYGQTPYGHQKKLSGAK